jgi:hypothetical protein
MGRRAEQELKDALVAWIGRGVGYHGQRTEYATVVTVDPALVLELQEGREMLSEGLRNLVIPKDQRALLGDVTEDDTAAVTLMGDGRYLLRHVVDNQ